MKIDYRKPAAMIAISGACIAFIATHEGFVDHTYDDAAGIKTIGYGHTGADVKAGQTITRQDAQELLVKDAQKHWDGIKKYIKVPISQNEADAYTSFAYNVGVNNFKNSTLLKKLNAKDYEGACKQLLRWNRSGGKVLKGLTKRRQAEYKMCIGG